MKYKNLLGCERVTGAKQTRVGCDYKTERFLNNVENVAQWDAKKSSGGEKNKQRTVLQLIHIKQSA